MMIPRTTRDVAVLSLLILVAGAYSFAAGDTAGERTADLVAVVSIGWFAYRLGAVTERDPEP